MTKTLIFHLSNNTQEDIINYFNLNFILQNSRTTIYSNDNMRLCFDKSVIRILVFNKDNKDLLKKIYKYFYKNAYLLD